MAENIAYIDKTLEDFRRQLSAKIDEAKKLLAVINTLEEMTKVPLTFLSDLGASGAVPNGNRANQGGAPRRIGTHVELRPDEYLGVAPLDAAKKYIASVGHAVQMDEIGDAVTRGGAAIKGSDWRDKLETSLIRSTYEIVKVQEHTFGLVSFYTEEQLKGLRETRRQQTEPTTKKRKASRRGKIRAKKAAALPEPKNEEPAAE